MMALSGACEWTGSILGSAGAGGMSYGFHAHPRFEIVGAVDAQIGKPSTGVGTLGCNSTYQLNMGLCPLDRDLATVRPSDLREDLGIDSGELTVLIACPPCT